MNRFEDIRVDVEGRFSLGIDHQSSAHYLSISVANRAVDYEELYQLDDTDYLSLSADRQLALTFAEDYRKRLHDDLLILKPGADRGSAIKCTASAV